MPAWFMCAAFAVVAAGCTQKAAGRKPDAATPSPRESSASASAEDATSGDVGAGRDDGGREAGSKVITAPLPATVLDSVLGCWQLGGSERFTITRTADGGAHVVGTVLGDDARTSPDYARRAAIPSDLMHNPSDGTFAFTTASRIHALMFMFTVTPKGLDGSWYSNHGTGYAWTGSNATLTRCLP